MLWAWKHHGLESRIVRKCRMLSSFCFPCSPRFLALAYKGHCFLSLHIILRSGQERRVASSSTVSLIRIKCKQDQRRSALGARSGIWYKGTRYLWPAPGEISDKGPFHNSDGTIALIEQGLLVTDQQFENIHFSPFCLSIKELVAETFKS